MTPPRANRSRFVGLARSVPLLEQLSGDPLAPGRAARSGRSAKLVARTTHADRVVQSVCPFCAVGCGQRVFVKDEQVIQIEGDPDSPVSRGRLCPKGAGSLGMVKSPTREYRVKYRRPYGTSWEELPLDRALDMIADRVIGTRARTWQAKIEDDEGKPAGKLNRTLGFASLGGATLDNEENYLMKKFFSALRRRARLAGRRWVAHRRAGGRRDQITLARPRCRDLGDRPAELDPQPPDLLRRPACNRREATHGSSGTLACAVRRDHGRDRRDRPAS
jgi:formate dehydrogenase major subunit